MCMCFWPIGDAKAECEVSRIGKHLYFFFFFFYRHVFEERLEGKGLSHGELILNEACLPAKYAKHHSVKRLGKQWWEQVVLQGPRRT